jgi:hypothetical protein
MSERYTLEQRMDARQEWNRRVMAAIDAMVDDGVRPSGKTAEAECGMALVLELTRLQAQAAAGLKIADEAAAVVLDSELLEAKVQGAKWLDLETVLQVADSGVQEMLRYLTARGKIQIHPSNPNLVRVVGAGEAAA